jgi:hypothetical protein
MRQRPWGIYVVIALQVALFVTLLPWFSENFPGLTPADNVNFSHELYVAWGVLNIVGALWLWTLNRRGWVLTMVLVGIGLVANLYLWALGQPAWVRMAIQAATAFYLNSSSIRALFERHNDIEPIVLRDTDAEAAT